MKLVIMGLLMSLSGVLVLAFFAHVILQKEPTINRSARLAIKVVVPLSMLLVFGGLIPMLIYSGMKPVNATGLASSLLVMLLGIFLVAMSGVVKCQVIDNVSTLFFGMVVSEIETVSTTLIGGVALIVLSIHLFLRCCN